MSFKPLHDRVLIEPAASETKTAGGIIIPDSAQEKPAEGIVRAAGPGARDGDGNRTALSVAVGDRVLYGKWSGTEVQVGGTDMVIMRESDLLGVME